MEHDPIHSPSEVDEGGWRGRVRGVTRIGAKAGFAAALVLAALFGLIVYGISTSGHRRAANAGAGTTLTKASEHQAPWWNAAPNVPPSALLLPSPTPTPTRIPRLSTEASSSAVRVPAIS